MNERCATEPLRLPDGRVIQPGDPLTLEDLCDVFSVFFEIELAKIQAQTPQNRPGVKAGQSVGLAPSLAPAGFKTPGQISNFGAPGGGPSSGPGSGGGGSFPGGGGGGGRRVQSGPPGPPGPPGPGTIEPGVVKTDGDFGVASAATDWTPVPGTLFNLTMTVQGWAYFFIQAAFGTRGNDASRTSGQIGLRIDGVDYPLSPNLFNTFVAGVGPLCNPAPSFWPIELTVGAHTVEVVIRGCNTFNTGLTQGTPLIVMANPVVPLAVGVIHT